MMEIGFAKSKDSSLESALEDNWVNPIKEVNNLLCNLFQTERCGISLAIPNEEAVEVDHLLVEPHVTGALDDDAMYFNSESLENCVNVGGTPCSIGYSDQRDDFAILDADVGQVGRQALKYDFMLQGPEENENLHVTCNLSCDCSDFLLEVVSAENSLDYSSNSEPPIRNMEYASHDALHSTFCGKSSSEAQTYHELLFDHQTNLTGLGNVSDLAFLSSENEDDMILIPGIELPERVFGSSASTPHNGANELPYGDGQADASLPAALEISGTANDSVTTTKRLRKPTRRYIEETSEIKPRGSYERLKMSLFSSNEKLLCPRIEEKYCRSGAVQLLHQDYPGKVHSLRGYRRKSTKQLVNDDGKGYILPSESAKVWTHSEQQEDDAWDESPTRVRKRRKHHRQWTHSEVVNLVDGVSQYGVGRWTEIKRLFFSTSSHRTAVDLKDKWRNLLRASVADPANRNLVEPQQKKQALAPIPPSILQRVRDLSIIHPYPRSQKPRITYLPTSRCSI